MAAQSAQLWMTVTRPGSAPLPATSRLAHRLADRDDAVRAGDEEAVDALEQPIDPLAPEVLEEARHLGEHVLAEEDEAARRSAGRTRARPGR